MMNSQTKNTLDDSTTPATDLLQDKSGELLKDLQASLNEAREESDALAPASASQTDRQKLIVVFDAAQRILDSARSANRR